MKQRFPEMPNQAGRRANKRLYLQKVEAYENHIIKSKNGKKGGKKSGKSRASKAKQKRSTAEANANPSSSSSTSSSIVDIPPNGGIPKNPKKDPTWPPPGKELKKDVFLTDDQVNALLKDMGKAELWYWINELAASAEQKPKHWKKAYTNHSLVVRKWRKAKLESGFIWNDSKRMYEYPPRAPAKSATERQLEKSGDLIKKLEDEENARKNATK